MACYPCIVERVKGGASDYERTAATIIFLLDECIVPSSVNVGEAFDIQIKYKLCTIETRDPDGRLVNFPGYDGMYYYYRNPIRTNMAYWVWRLQAMKMTFLGNTVQQYGRGAISPGDEFIYTWHGTIEELFPEEQFTATTIKTLFCRIYGLIYGWHEPSDWWPWNWSPSENFFDEIAVDEAHCDIQVNVPPPPPPPPYPTFNIDLCSVSKATVAPNESFKIKVTIENQNEGSGQYYIDYYCEGNQGELAAGTIGGLATKSHTFSVTANQLAQRSIIASQYLAFTIAVSNDEGETDRWTPAAIAVIVTEPPETANLSGRVSDKQTGLALAEVSVSTAGYSASTDSSGHYALEGLEPGVHDIRFSKSDYWEETKSKTLNVGQNTLNFAMTPTTEPPPPEPSFPWALIGAGAATIIGVILILKGVERGAKK